MNLTELTEKIKSHLVAGYPGLYIHSSEEARVDSMLRDVAAQLQLSPKEWNLGYGWVDFFNKQPRGNQGPDTDLANSLPALLDDDLGGYVAPVDDDPVGHLFTPLFRQNARGSGDGLRF